MKRLLGILLLVVLNITVQLSICCAQQNALFSQYTFNKLLINPAYCGSSNFTMGSLAYKNKFLGLDGSPKTMGFTIHRPIQSQSMGLGLKAMNDKAGVTTQTSIVAIYAYHLKLATGNLSFGIEGGLFSQTIDFTNLIRSDLADAAVPNGKENAMLPDAAFGMYYQYDEFHAGVSVYHLLQNRINYTGNQRDLEASLSRHYLLTAGYGLSVKEDINVEPSILLKYVAGAPLQVDINANAIYKEMFTVGAGYRTGDAIILLFQYTFKQRIRFGYSYDYSISKLASYNSGSHEIMLSYAIPVKEKVREPEIEEEIIIDTTEAFISEDSLEIADTALVMDTAFTEDSLAIADTALVMDTAFTEDSLAITDTALVMDTAFTEDSLAIADTALVMDTSALEDSVVEVSNVVVPIGKDTLDQVDTTASVEKPPEEVLLEESMGDDGILFKIHIHAALDPVYIVPENFKGLENVVEYQDDDSFTYLFGKSPYYDYTNAILLTEVRDLGYKDAFIVAFRNGRKISMEEALNTPGGTKMNTGLESSGSTVLKGKVISAGMAVQGVSIKLLSENADLIEELITSETGEFSFNITDEQEYSLYLTKPGYFDRFEVVESGGNNNGIIQLNFELTKQ